VVCLSVKKILFVFGTRPEAIKMAPLVKEFQKYSSDFDVKVCVTAQHREMLDQVLSLFDIVPDFDLNLMKSGQDLYDITSSVLLSLRYILNDIKPDYVFVHGDTTTTFSASLAAYYQKIPVVHIEAGLRSSNIYSPFPEEINRVLTSKIAKYHFSPTSRAAENLISEGIDETDIFITGNTVIDALFQITKRIENQNISIKGYNFSSRKIILVTGHRRENFGQGFLNICDALSLLAKKFPEIDIVYPVHLNPNVNAPVKKLLDNIKNIFLIEPLEYIDFVYLMNRSYIILTDSGGIQEEAPSLGKPVLVMRENTERPEAVEAGTVKLVGTSSAMIVKHTSDLLDDDHYYLSMSQAHNPYGDGNSSKKITETFKTLVSL
jgi:UDP-N-acetylglucosamine 2-epimerase (non-hydrolysing)